MDMDRARSIVAEQIEEHKKIYEAALELGEHRMALEHRDIMEGMETVLEAVK